MSKIAWSLIIALLATPVAPRLAHADNKRVCVEVVLQRSAARLPGPRVEGAAEPPANKIDASVVVAGSDADVLPPQADKGAGKLNIPIGQRPLAYLKRLMEHFISHEKGFTAVQSGCEQTMRIELYPLLDGWTAFARYSGTGREERVDRLAPSELSQFAERAATALLHGKPISATINRETVLLSDSKEYVQRIGGTHHFMMGVGTQLRVGRFDTVIDDSADPDKGKTRSQLRFFSPVSFLMGYRGRYESWGLETNVMASVGTAKTSAAKNPAGGHVDLGGNGALQLHFLHYFDPRGLLSFYMGAGTTFELMVFQPVRAAQRRDAGSRSYLLAGGLDVDLVLGWEFMRASTAQFFLQADLQAPAYVLANENEDGGVRGWFPAVAIKLGVMF